MDAASADGLDDYVMLDADTIEEAVSDIHISFSSKLTFGRRSWQTLSTLLTTSRRGVVATTLIIKSWTYQGIPNHYTHR